MADKISADDALNFSAIITHGHHWFKLLLETAVVAAESNIRSRSHTPSSPRRTAVVQSVELLSTGSESVDPSRTTLVPKTTKGW